MSIADNDISDDELRLRERSCLVKHNGVDVLSALEILTTLNEDAVLGTQPRANHHGSWRCEAQGTRTGNHEYRNRAQKSKVERNSDERRRCEGEKRRDHHARNEIV